MIDLALSIVGLNSTDTNIKLHDTPTNTISQYSSTAKPRQQKWNYRSAVGCLSYTQSIIFRDITFSVQQYAPFHNNPNQQHEEAAGYTTNYM